MNDKVLDITDLSKEELIRLVGIFMGDVLVHYGMWFTEVVYRQGIETECVWCPPDRVPDEEFCTWRFRLQE